MLLDDPRTCAVNTVFKSGVPVATAPRRVSTNATNTVRPRCRKPPRSGPSGRVHVIGVRHGRIFRSRHVLDDDAPGVAGLTVLERHGMGSPPANAYVTGFGAGLRGASASSVGHDSHNLIVVGSNIQDMRTALAALIQSGGGFSVVRDGAAKALLPLPFGGLMSLKSHGDIAKELRTLKAAARGIGCELPEPFLQLAFLSCQ